MNIKILCLLFFLPSLINAQSILSGTVNEYARVLVIEPCESSLTLEGPHSFEVGDPVLLIQMNGAVINESDSDAFGSIEDIGSTGLFEENEIIAVDGNEVTFKFLLTHTYETNNMVQLVSFPKFDFAIVEDTIKGKAWDGTTGGVIAFQVDQELTLNASIDASGIGFRGAATNSNASNCNFLTNATGYHYSLSNWRGAPKGEGVASYISGKEQGRGAQANGGGGGNDHNAGGGGGANKSNGGIGGENSTPGLGCDGEYPGKGGKPLPMSTSRIFLGGGGGAGHDNNNVATAGGNGGGIVIIKASTIVSNSQTITSNGMDALTSPGDGAGGGGGGGSILLISESISEPLNIIANGGKGGDCLNPADRCFGAGGGGSGGSFLSNTSNNINLTIAGGTAGANLTSSNQCNNDPSNGAQAGIAGEEQLIDSIAMSSFEQMLTAITANPVSQIVCENDTVQFVVQAMGNSLTFQWEMLENGVWIDIQPGIGFEGEQTNILQIPAVNIALDGQQFRCMISNPCTQDTSSIATLSVEPSPQVAFDISVLGNLQIELTNNSNASVDYLWDFGDGLSSDEPDPVHTYAQAGSYTVTLTALSGCGSASLSQQVVLQNEPIADYTLNMSTGCVPATIEFESLASANTESVEWLFPGGTPNSSTSFQPVVSYNTEGLYDVTMIAFNSAGSDTIVNVNAIDIGASPVADFNSTVSLLEVQFNNQSQGVGNSFLWDFGDGMISTDINPLHLFQNSGTYTILLTVTNNCGSSTAEELITVGGFPVADFGFSSNSLCVPAIVQYEDLSSGENILAHQWTFEGGDPAVSSEQNPIVSYLIPGLYDVELTVINALGENSIALEDYIEILPNPIADFIVEINMDTVRLTDTSFGASYWLWDFGDGNTSTEMNPEHIYQNGGAFQITLTVGNDQCGSAISQEIMIDLPNATDESVEAKKVKIWPNPFNDEVELIFEDWKGVYWETKIYTSAGQCVYTAILEQKTNLLALPNMPAGVYLLLLKNGEQTIHHKLIKQ